MGRKRRDGVVGHSGARRWQRRPRRACDCERVDDALDDIGTHSSRHFHANADADSDAYADANTDADADADAF